MKRCRLMILAFSVILCGSAAFADDLNLGSSYNTVTFYQNGNLATVGAGSMKPSTLNGVALAFVYCVDLFDDVGVPADYPSTIVTHNGVVNGSAVNNAGEIAWLLDAFGVSAQGNTNAEEALQVAIWHVEYGSNYHADSTQSYNSYYVSDLAALGNKTASVANLDWLTPGGTGTREQGLVAAAGVVPEPSSILLFGTILLFAAVLMKRKQVRTGR
jgi:hypothetical protein